MDPGDVKFAMTNQHGSTKKLSAATRFLFSGV